MKIGILGFGDQNRSVFNYLTNQGDYDITICDLNDTLEVGGDTKTQFGPEYLSNLDQFDLLYRSPSVHPKDIVKANTPEILSKVTSATNEFFKVSPTNNIIGVTGTKGKGTTSTLIAKMLEASGKTVHLGGNIGTPPLDLLKNNIATEDWVVLELANYQLIDLKYSPKIALCLMFVPEHLDWHEDEQEYLISKQQLFLHQKESDIAVYFGKDAKSKEIASVSSGIKIPYFMPPGAYVESDQIVIDNQKISNVSELRLLGKHNWQNVCAAVTIVWQIDQNVEAVHGVLTTFKGLEHRLELVKELDQVKYYDDSFATTPESAIVAIEAFQQPKVVILGGSDKNASYIELARVVKNSNVRGVVTVGVTGPAIEKALRSTGYLNVVDGGESMDEYVSTAKSIAKPGDVILLSPGCASFGVFKNYKDRGEKFHQSVEALV